MGCRLPTLRRPEERSPGKIYSTLRRPQVETKVGVAYTYHFLDFLLGKEEVSVSSVLCLSSVRELPVQLRDLYAQGFVLVALHPFVHPCGPRHARVQRLLHRAVLVRETHSQEKTQLKWAGHRLETDVCVTGHQVPDPEMIQNYVKKVQDVSDQGVLFVGFLQQLGGPPCFPGHLDPEELSSLHSSPSPVHRTPPTGGTSTSASLSPTEPGEQNLPEPRDHLEQEPEHGVLEPREPDFGSLERCQVLQAFPERRAEEPTGGEQKRGSVKALKEPDFDPVEPTETPGRTGWNPDAWNRREGRNPSPDRRYRKAERTYLDPDGEWNGVGCGRDREPQSGSEEPLHRGSAVERGRHGDGLILDASHLEELHRTSRLPTHNNNHIQVKRSEREKKTATSPPAQTRMQLFALYNHVGEPCSSLRFYSLRVPLQVQREAGLVTAVDAHWLDHMTQHFTGGARLIDGFFHLGDSGDNGFSSVDSVFIFQSSSEEATPTSYDAIVVEQWTVVDGVVVRTDYIPLLQSLAPFGWRLMCVLPTPIVKANSDGSLSTKQILFLQRPMLQRKRKDFKKLNLRGWSKATKNLTRETPEKNEERENGSPLTGRTGRNVRGEGEERESQENRENRKKDGGGGEWPRRDGGGGKEGERGSQEGETTDANQEEETTGAEPIPSANQKSVRWTDERERGGAGDGEGGKAEISRHLGERALFSGVC